MAPNAEQPRKRVSASPSRERESSLAARPALFWTADSSLRITAIDGSALALLHVRAEELLGRTLPEILHADAADSPFLNAHYRALEGVSQEFEGGWSGRRFEAHLEPMRSASGEISGVIGLARERLARRGSQLAEKLEAAAGREAQYRALVENSADLLALLSAEGTVLYANPAISRLLGYTAEELAGKQAFDLIHPEELDELQGLFRGLLGKPGSRSVCEFRVRDRNAAWHCMEGSAINLLNEPSVQAVVVTAAEITDRKRAETERQVISEIIDALNVTSRLNELFVQIHRALKKVLYAENCFVALYDKETETFHFPFFVDRFDTAPAPQKVGRSCTAYVFHNGWPMLINQKVFDEMVRRGDVELVGTPSPTWLGVPLRTPSATLGVLVVQHYEDSTVYTERDLDFLNSVGGHIALAIERKAADDALRKQQEEQQIIFHAAPLMILYKDRENRILRANRAAALANGVEVEELEGRTDSEHAAEQAEKHHRDDLDVIRSSNPKLGILEEFQTPSGEMRMLHTDKIPYRDQHGNIIGVIVFSTDVTEAHHAREALRRSEANYRSLINNAPYGVCWASAEGTLLDVNPALVEMLGYESEAELQGLNLVSRVFADSGLREADFARSGGAQFRRRVGVEETGRNLDYGAPVGTACARSGVAQRPLRIGRGKYHGTAGARDSAAPGREDGSDWQIGRRRGA